MRLYLTALAVATALLLACDSEPEPPPGVYVNVFTVQTGECFWRQYPDSPVWSTVKIVPCGGKDWQFAVVSRFVIEAEGPFPHHKFFEDEAIAHCEQGWTTYLAPLKDGWERGDRDMICLLQPGAPARSVSSLASNVSPRASSLLLYAGLASHRAGTPRGSRSHA